MSHAARAAEVAVIVILSIVVIGIVFWRLYILQIARRRAHIAKLIAEEKLAASNAGGNVPPLPVSNGVVQSNNTKQRVTATGELDPNEDMVSVPVTQVPLFDKFLKFDRDFYRRADSATDVAPMPSIPAPAATTSNLQSNLHVNTALVDIIPSTDDFGASFPWNTYANPDFRNSPGSTPYHPGSKSLDIPRGYAPSGAYYSRFDEPSNLNERLYLQQQQQRQQQQQQQQQRQQQNYSGMQYDSESQSSPHRTVQMSRQSDFDDALRYYSFDAERQKSSNQQDRTDGVYDGYQRRNSNNQSWLAGSPLDIKQLMAYGTSSSPERDRRGRDFDRASGERAPSVAFADSRYDLTTNLGRNDSDTMHHYDKNDTGLSQQRRDNFRRNGITTGVDSNYQLNDTRIVSTNSSTFSLSKNASFQLQDKQQQKQQIQNDTSNRSYALSDQTRDREQQRPPNSVLVKSTRLPDGRQQQQKQQPDFYSLSSVAPVAEQGNSNRATVSTTMLASSTNAGKRGSIGGKLTDIPSESIELRSSRVKGPRDSQRSSILTVTAVKVADGVRNSVASKTYDNDNESEMNVGISKVGYSNTSDKQKGSATSRYNYSLDYQNSFSGMNGDFGESPTKNMKQDNIYFSSFNKSTSTIPDLDLTLGPGPSGGTRTDQGLSESNIANGIDFGDRRAFSFDINLNNNSNSKLNMANFANRPSNDAVRPDNDTSDIQSNQVQRRLSNLMRNSLKPAAKKVTETSEKVIPTKVILRSSDELSHSSVEPYKVEPAALVATAVPTPAQKDGKAAVSTGRLAGIQRSLGSSRLIRVPFSRGYRTHGVNIINPSVAEIDDTTNTSGSDTTDARRTSLDNGGDDSQYLGQMGGVDMERKPASSSKYVLPQLDILSNSSDKRRSTGMISGDSTDAADRFNDGGYDQYQQQQQYLSSRPLAARRRSSSSAIGSVYVLPHIREATNEDHTSMNDTQLTSSYNNKYSGMSNEDPRDMERSDSLYSKIRLDSVYNREGTPNSIATTPVEYKRANGSTSSLEFLKPYEMYLQ